ncbi:SulP family inorganic anion transporter [Candidatus Chloroploca sp. Khr17]|uniref:SulP family inorganic anion transporter n=1 Tax=Candidatus Chloroploca sp. Khr17 TaxID=2496869 RepID=UPI00101D1071|nr:SulP family inorganic anion transporter [Candidatus Chloroploca sp. Khr17]
MLAYLRTMPVLLSQPVRLLRGYPLVALRSDLLAGLTVGLVLLPQALAFALLAGLPPTMGLYTAFVASMVGALWGSSSHLNSGPTNTASILTLSILAPLFLPGSPEFLLAAGLLAVLAGLIRLLMGLARLGILVNFVSDSVAVGFTAGAGLLIMSNQIGPILRLSIPATEGPLGSVIGAVSQLEAVHVPSLVLGVATIGLIIFWPRVTRVVPAVLVGVTAISLSAWVLQLEGQGVRLLGTLPQGLPPFTSLPLFDLNLIGQLANGALAIALIGLVEAVAIARAVASHSRQRLDSNQEFVGQGMANIAAGFFGGHPCSGSFNRSALSYQAGGMTALGNAFSGVFVLVAAFVLSDVIAQIPLAVLAGALAVTAWSMIDLRSMKRIWRGAPGDAVIMVVTFLATLVLPLQFAILIGVLMSLGYYLLRTSMPRVVAVLPDLTFSHWAAFPERPQCPQLAVVDVLGDLYFGAVNHIEEELLRILDAPPGQRFLLLRMHSVQHCDISGIRMLENVRRVVRDRGGEIYFVRVRDPVLERMRLTGFYDQVGAARFLDEDLAIETIFYRILDPAVCIYECEWRAFRECHSLPKRTLPGGAPPIPLLPLGSVSAPTVAAHELWKMMHDKVPPLVVDVREPREFRLGHIPGAISIPLSDLLINPSDLPREAPLILVCRSGRRSERAFLALTEQRYANVRILGGGLLTWEGQNLLMAVET